MLKALNCIWSFSALIHLTAASLWEHMAHTDTYWSISAGKPGWRKRAVSLMHPQTQRNVQALPPHATRILQPGLHHASKFGRFLWVFVHVRLIFLRYRLCSLLGSGNGQSSPSTNTGASRSSVATARAGPLLPGMWRDPGISGSSELATCTWWLSFNDEELLPFITNRWGLTLKPISGMALLPLARPACISAEGLLEIRITEGRLLTQVLYISMQILFYAGWYIM